MAKYKDPRYTEEGYENFRKYQNEYIKTHYKSILLRFHTENEADVIEYLQTIDAIAPYIKSLIKEDMKKKQSED